jgi:hypothetical protein
MTVKSCPTNKDGVLFKKNIINANLGKSTISVRVLKLLKTSSTVLMLFFSQTPLRTSFLQYLKSLDYKKDFLPAAQYCITNALHFYPPFQDLISLGFVRAPLALSLSLSLSFSLTLAAPKRHLLPVSSHIAKF